MADSRGLLNSLYQGQTVPCTAVLRCQNGDNLRRRGGYLVVDHQIVVVGDLLVLLPRLLEPAGNHVLIVGGAAVEAAGKA